MKRSGRPSTINRVATALLGASLGAAGGYLVALQQLPPAVIEENRIPPMWASAGAVVGVLVMRLGALLLMMIRDYRDSA